MILTPQARQRGLKIIAALLIASGILIFVITLMRDHIVYFLSPSEWHQRQNDPKIRNSKQLRLGGLVKERSLSSHHGIHKFMLTDRMVDIPIVFKGPLPSLFREGQGVVILGNFKEKKKTFEAHQVLAKHDERYIPKDVSDSLKQKKLWRGSK